MPERICSISAFGSPEPESSFEISSLTGVPLSASSSFASGLPPSSSSSLPARGPSASVSFSWSCLAPSPLSSSSSVAPLPVSVSITSLSAFSSVAGSRPSSEGSSESFSVSFAARQRTEGGLAEHFFDLFGGRDRDLRSRPAGCGGRQGSQQGEGGARQQGEGQHPYAAQGRRGGGDGSRHGSFLEERGDRSAAIPPIPRRGTFFKQTSRPR